MVWGREKGSGGNSRLKGIWGGDRGGVEKNIHKKYFQILSITKIHKNSQKITKNHKKSQKCTVLGRCNSMFVCLFAYVCVCVFRFET